MCLRVDVKEKTMCWRVDVKEITMCWKSLRKGDNNVLER